MKNKLIAFMFAAAALAACTKSQDEPEGSITLISGGELVFETTGGTQSAAFKTTASWKAAVSGSAAWVSINPSSGNQGDNNKLYVTLQSYSGSEPRSATIEISCGAAKLNISVTQKQQTAVIPARTQYQVGCSGGELGIPVGHNVDITASISAEADWIHAADTKAFVTDTLKFIIDPNSATSSRSASITFMSTDKKVKQAVTITQSGRMGVVKYSDGQPAAGVSVSDGFNVVTTDENGNFDLPTDVPDSRYIYISYPSDAKITTDSGLPQFFQTRSSGKSYTFTLERQAVENEFALFAMADPQAHYTARSPQKTSDVSRFGNESVPAINSQIKAQSVPCYGVTLGDIVYSESSRNSNPGMTQMLTNFASINMPVFQTMGNHDYTYFYSTKPLTTDSGSSTLYLKAQRVFEECFGPVNFSFNRGNVHVVCMRDIIYDSTTDASDYHGGFTNEQYNWLKADLDNVSKDKMVILCVHIPICGITAKENVANVLNLIKQYKNSTVFSGHTHYYRGYPNLGGSSMYEHIHSAVCGQWWWSRMEGDGCPNGYTIYKINGNEIKDAYFIGVNDKMNTRDYQMRIYRGNTLNGGSHAYFQWPHSNQTYLINVFSGDARWKVRVYEDGQYAGDATLMSNSRTTYASVTSGTVYTVPTTSSQDWWSIGYHIGVCGRGRTSTSYYTSNFHMFKYVAKSATSKIKVEATDPYGNVYTGEEVIENSSTSYTYPDYVRQPLSN